MTRIPLYFAALALLTAALVALGTLPVYVATLVLAAGLLLFAGGAWRRVIRRGVSDTEVFHKPKQHVQNWPH